MTDIISSDFCVSLTGLTSDCTSLSRFMQIISTKEIMAFKVCGFYCFIPTKHNTWQKQRTLPLPYSILPPSGSPSLLPKPSNQIQVSGPIKQVTEPLCNIFLLKKFMCPACLAGKVAFCPLLQVPHCSLVL